MNEENEPEEERERDQIDSIEPPNGSNVESVTTSFRSKVNNNHYARSTFLPSASKTCNSSLTALSLSLSL